MARVALEDPVVPLHLVQPMAALEQASRMLQRYPSKAWRAIRLQFIVLDGVIGAVAAAFAIDSLATHHYKHFEISCEVFVLWTLCVFFYLLYNNWPYRVRRNYIERHVLPEAYKLAYRNDSKGLKALINSKVVDYIIGTKRYDSNLSDVVWCAVTSSLYSGDDSIMAPHA